MIYSVIYNDNLECTYSYTHSSIFVSQFKENIKDVMKDSFNDAYLLRWLRGEFIYEIYTINGKSKINTVWKQQSIVLELSNSFKHMKINFKI